VYTERENHTLKTEENTMTDQTNTYFQAINQANTGAHFTGGQLKAYRAWLGSTRNESSAFEVQDLPWDRDIHDFVETLRAAGIAEFAVTDQSTALMRNLHQLTDEGCTMLGLCKVTRSETRWGNEGATEYDGILFHT